MNETRSPHRSRDAGARILAKSLESAVDVSVKEFGGQLLGKILLAALAGPVATVLATVAKEIVSTLLQQASSIEDKLDQIRQAPFANAVNTLRDVLASRFETPEELAECDRRLAQAANDLGLAYTYAEQDSSHSTALVTMYQALVAALKSGADPLVLTYTRRLKLLSESTRRSARQALAEAGALQGARSYTKLQLGRIEGISREQLREEERKAALEREATTLADEADAIERFCAFVAQLSANRTSVLKEPK